MVTGYSRTGRSLYLIAVLAVSLTVPTGSAAREILRIGYFDLPPHVVQVAGGPPKGAAVGYFEAFIAPRLGVEIVWDSQAMPPTRLMEQLRTGEKDAMIFLGWTEQRTTYLHYPKPYLTLIETLAFRADSSLAQVTAVDDLHGLTGSGSWSVGAYPTGSETSASHTI